MEDQEPLFHNFPNSCIIDESLFNINNELKRERIKKINELRTRLQMKVHQMTRLSPKIDRITSINESLMKIFDEKVINGLDLEFHFLVRQIEESLITSPVVDVREIIIHDDDREIDDNHHPQLEEKDNDDNDDVVIINNEEPTIEEQHKCLVCHLKKSSNKSLMKHLRLNHSDLVDNYKSLIGFLENTQELECPSCPPSIATKELFSSRRRFFEHFRLFHEKKFNDLILFLKMSEELNNFKKIFDKINDKIEKRNKKWNEDHDNESVVEIPRFICKPPASFPSSLTTRQLTVVVSNEQETEVSEDGQEESKGEKRKKKNRTKEDDLLEEEVHEVKKEKKSKKSQKDHHHN